MHVARTPSPSVTVTYVPLPLWFLENGRANARPESEEEHDKQRALGPESPESRDKERVARRTQLLGINALPKLQLKEPLSYHLIVLPNTTATTKTLQTYSVHTYPYNVRSTSYIHTYIHGRLLRVS